MLWPRPLAQLLQAIAPDVVHTHSGAWFKTARAARLAGVPAVVHTEHGRPDPDPLPGRAIEYLASRKTDVLVAVSSDLGEKMTAWVSRRCRVEVVENGVDTDHFAPGGDATPWRGRLGIAPSAAIIGCVARLDPIKNFDMLLESLAIVRAGWTHGAPPVLVIAGDGPERERITALATTMGLDDAVHLIGWVSDTVELYPMFDLFTLSSRSEGTSIALLEAMSAGVCPVVTAVGGNLSVLGPELTELLVPSGDARALADRWRALLTDPSARAALGQSARRRVVAHFSLGQMVARHEAMYEQLAGRSGGTTHAPGAM